MHHSVMIEPMLGFVNLRPYFSKYRKADGTPLIESVSAGGESGPDARPCDFAWVLDSHMQCVENGVPFSYHQTGARLIKGGKVFDIPREAQHSQAHKAKLDFNGTSLIGMPGE
jgi:protein gp37